MCQRHSRLACAGMPSPARAPVEVDAPKRRRLVEMGETVACERLRHLVPILLLPGKIEPGHHSRVLIEARPFRQSTQSAFNLTNTGFKF